MLNAIKRWWNKPAREIQELCQLAEAFARADEREACARLAESATAYTQFQAVEHYKIAAAIAAGIRMRSNVEFSGGAPLHGAASAGTHGYALEDEE